MRGHEDVIKRRTETRLKPPAVFINDYSCKHVGYCKISGSAMPTVSIDGDFIPSLDLRFVVGCVVSANGSTEERAKALFNRLIQFKPMMCAVGTLESDPKKRPKDMTGWIGLYTEEQGIIRG